MMGLPKWLRGNEGDVDMTHDEVPLPQIATVEKKPLPFHIAPDGVRGGYQAPAGGDKPAVPTTGSGVDEANVVVQAHQFVEQWKIKDAAQLQKIEQLESDLKAKSRECDLLELDIAQQLNTIATLQSEVLALKERDKKVGQFLSVKKQICERELLTYQQFNIDDPPKKERKPPKAKHPKKALADGTMPGDQTK